MYSDEGFDGDYNFAIKHDRPAFKIQRGYERSRSNYRIITLKSSCWLTLDAHISVKAWTRVMFDGKIIIFIEFPIIIYQLGLKIQQFRRFSP